MAVQKVTENIDYVGARDWDRRLFDELIPLPEGTSYNSYLVRGSEKTALIDTVEPEKFYVLRDNLKHLNVDRIDYIICNHAEQDHSGSIPEILQRYPAARVVTNAKCRDFLKDLLHLVDDRFITINDGDTLPLGGRTLEFILAAWVHWPETMLTYLREERILFSCDLFGSHLASSNLFAGEEVYNPAKRYYAEIMMPFRAIISKHLAKIANYEIAMICPSHGPVYDRPGFILDAYRDWNSDKVKNEVIVGFVSMHGSTRKIAEYFIDELIGRGLVVKPYNLAVHDLGFLAMDLVDAATLAVAAPTVLTGIHPAALLPLYLVNLLRPKLRHLGIIGSYGWAPVAMDKITGMLGNLKAEMLPPVLVRGFPRPADFTALGQLADTVAAKHRDL